MNKVEELILGLLGITFVVLKLTNVIDWSWWLVTLPFWGGFVLAIVVSFIYVILKNIFSKKGGVPKPKEYPEPPKKKSRFQQRMEEMQNERRNNK